MPGRILCWIGLIFAAVSLPGCNILIRNSGETLNGLDSRDVVVSRFGLPERVDEIHLLEPETNEVHRFDVEKYRVHANYNTGGPIGAGGGMLLLLDPWLTCVALCEKVRDIRDGHDLAFVYDADGNTIGHQYPQPFLQNHWIDKTNVLHWDEAESHAAEHMVR